MSRDLHNVVVPVDLSSLEDMILAALNFQAFIKRLIPVRFGLVPTTTSAESIAQLKVVHYLQEAYGLASLIQYLEKVSTYQ